MSRATSFVKLLAGFLSAPESIHEMLRMIEVIREDERLKDLTFVHEVQKKEKEKF